ncbi:hypothetical protein MKY04_16225 [Lysinibacillus telephonicus]|uniref:hypothetical protein n=1 Tax=Lysinibacillus telephonicus TaxID=1714840 RepID=UPI0031FC2354
MNNRIPIIESYINQKLTSYKKFMLIEKMPTFQLVIDETKITASHNYNVQTDKHSLIVGPNIINKNMEYILFHEFTHMYDVITFSAKNPDVYFANRGYTEYHASQIELLKLLGARDVNDNVTFSLTQPIETIFGNTTLLEYILKLRDTVREEICEINFPGSIASLSSALGMIFNHLGRISICRLYASDYDLFKKELEELDFAISFLGENFLKIISIAKGFLNNKEIADFAILFYPIAYELIKKYDF